MRIVITGGGGFIGSWLAERLAGAHEVVLVDKSFEGSSVAATSLRANRRVHLVEGDVLDYDRMAYCLQGAQGVIHAAAVLGVARVVADPGRTLEVNYRGLANVLKAAQASAALGRFVFLSSSEVYGLQAMEAQEDGEARFAPLADPRWSYAISKLAGEQLCLSAYRTSSVPVVVVRPFNVFGPRRLGEHAVLRFCLNALKGEPLVVNGDGSQVRAWCYVDDFVDGVMACLNEEAAVGQAFNIGNPRNAISVYDLAVKVRGLCDSRAPIVMRPSEVPDIPARVPRIERARNLLGFEPKVTLEDGLRATVQWYRSFGGGL